MNPLKITVITPSYNQADYLEEALKSVLEQNYADFEYIVMDGGSTDGSVEIIEKYSERLTYWTSETDEGQSDAINKGFARGTGDIFCWINSDDLLAPDALKTVAKYFTENPDWQVMNGGCALIHGNNRHSSDESTIRYLNCPIQQVFTNWKRNWFAQQSTFWRSELWRTVGPLRKDLHFTMDFELWGRFAARTKFHSVPEILAVYRLHDTAKCIADHGTKTMEMYRLQTESTPAEAAPFLISTGQLFEDLVSEYETQHIRLRKLMAENRELNAQNASHRAHVESLKNSRWIRVGGRITRYLNFFRSCFRAEKDEFSG